MHDSNVPRGSWINGGTRGGSSQTAVLLPSTTFVTSLADGAVRRVDFWPTTTTSLHYTKIHRSVWGRIILTRNEDSVGSGLFGSMHGLSFEIKLTTFLFARFQFR
mmetsp:Transcript_40401/g.59908  ORF Transcript_40401/g.59908 Transcript_40401/m.59908 type:complete len:105 (-) Transcript_40401:642-956(-)